LRNKINLPMITEINLLQKLGQSIGQNAVGQCAKGSAIQWDNKRCPIGRGGFIEIGPKELGDSGRRIPRLKIKKDN
jgi:hypothetical protein